MWDPSFYHLSLLTFTPALLDIEPLPFTLSSASLKPYFFEHSQGGFSLILASEHVAALRLAAKTWLTRVENMPCRH